MALRSNKNPHIHRCRAFQKEAPSINRSEGERSIQSSQFTTGLQFNSQQLVGKGWPVAQGRSHPEVLTSTGKRISDKHAGKTVNRKVYERNRVHMQTQPIPPRRGNKQPKHECMTISSQIPRSATSGGSSDCLEPNLLLLSGLLS
jgi:hypothetical protein